MVQTNKIYSMKNLKIDIAYHLDSIVIRFANRRLILLPHEHGISVIFKRLITAEEKIKHKENPDIPFQCAGTEIINNRIVDTNINMSYEAAYVLAEALYTQQKEIRVRQILNTIFKGARKAEAMKIINEINEDEFMAINQMFLDQQYHQIDLYLSSLKYRLCTDNEMEQKDSNDFNE